MEFLFIDGKEVRNEQVNDFWFDGMRFVYEQLLNSPLLNEFTIGYGGSIGGAIKHLFKEKIGNKNFSRKPVVWFYAGGPFESPYLKMCDIIFVEDEYARDKMITEGYSKVYVAFGINLLVFFPIKELEEFPFGEPPKLWDYIYPAAFADWKNHDKWLEKVQKEKAKGLAVGVFTPPSYTILKMLWDGGVTILPIVPPKTLNWLYNYSKKLYLPVGDMGGGQRAVLEARAVGLEIEVESERLKKLAEGPLLSHLDYWDMVQNILGVFVKCGVY